MIRLRFVFSIKVLIYHLYNYTPVPLTAHIQRHFFIYSIPLFLLTHSAKSMISPFSPLLTSLILKSLKKEISHNSLCVTSPTVRSVSLASKYERFQSMDVTSYILSTTDKYLIFLLLIVCVLLKNHIGRG